MTGRVVTLVLAKSVGGAGRHVRDLAGFLVAAGERVTVAGPPETDHVFGFTETGAGFAPTDIAAGADVGTDLRAVRRLRPLLRGSDLVHAHGLRAGALTAAADVPARTPLVVTWHNASFAEGGLRPVYAVLECWVARRADATLCVSSDLLDRVVQLGGKDVRLAPVGAPPPASSRRRPADVRAELGAVGRPLVVAVGRLAPQKDFGVLVRCAAAWADRDPRPVVAIAGEGPEEAALSSLSHELRAEVRLLGHRDDVIDLMQAADVVAMPSRWEGSPLAAHEALRGGRPLVAFAVGGLPDLLGGGARLLTPGDEAGFAAAVADLLDDPTAAAELGRQAVRCAARWPDAEAAARQVMAAYEELWR